MSTETNNMNWVKPKEHVIDWRGFNSFAYSNEVWINNQDKALFKTFFPHVAVECRSCPQAQQVAEAILYAVENKGLLITRHYAKRGMQNRYTMGNKTIVGGKGINPHELMQFLGME